MYWLLKYVLAGPLFHLFFRPWSLGVENVPRRGGVIIVSNHLSFVDSLVIALFMDRPVKFLAKKEYFAGRGFTGWAMRTFMRTVGQIPMDRSGGKASEMSLNSGLGALESGRVLAIYPEGTRSPNGSLYRGRTGVARMVLEAGVLVVPTALFDTHRMMPVGSIAPRFRRAGLICGKPLNFSRYKGLEGDRFVLRSITDEIMYEIAKLSGQDYVDLYASSLKKEAR